MISLARILHYLCGPVFLGFLFLVLAGGSVQAQTYINFEGKLTRPICLSPDGTRLFAVNTADARLSVFDVTHPLNPFLIAEIPIGIEPVSVNARNNDEAWVVNEESDSVSVVSVSKGIVADTLYAKDEPADVVFAAGKAFVSESRNHQLAVFDVSSHALLTNIVLFGECPRSLAVNSNATKVYAAFALSGNRTTIISLSNAPPQSPATNNPPKVSLIVDATDAAWNPSVIQFTMPDNDIAEIDVATMTTNRYFTRVGTVNLGIAVQPGSGALFLANTDARNLVHFESNLKSFFATNRVSRVDVASGVSTPYDLNPGFDPTNFTLANRTNVELIVMGSLDGVPHGLFYQGSSNLYAPDSTNLPSLTHTQLVTKVLAGDTLTIMGVPPGSGQRMAIDRDLNGVLDADEPRPSLQISQSSGKLFVTWPLSAAGYTLQQATNLTAAAWVTYTNPVEIIGSSNVVTNDIPAAALYFRLRR